LEVVQTGDRTVVADNEMSAEERLLVDGDEQRLQFGESRLGPGELDAVEDAQVNLTLLETLAEFSGIAAGDKLAAHAGLSLQQRLEWPHDDLHQRFRRIAKQTGNQADADRLRRPGRGTRAERRQRQDQSEGRKYPCRTAPLAASHDFPPFRSS